MLVLDQKYHVFYMRKKIREDRKRKKISTTINTELWELMNKYSDKIGQNKSRIIEKWIKEGLGNKEILSKLNDEDIILPESDLLK